MLITRSSADNAPENGQTFYEKLNKFLVPGRYGCLKGGIGGLVHVVNDSGVIRKEELHNIYITARDS
jgi:hypothetical protein